MLRGTAETRDGHLEGFRQKVADCPGLRRKELRTEQQREDKRVTAVWDSAQGN